MTQTIDPIKLKAAAEHLEWVLKQYPGDSTVQGLLQSLIPLIMDAKKEKILAPVDRMKIPGAWSFGDGLYRPYENPNIESAYFEFSTEMRGGHDEDEIRLIEDTQAMFERMKNNG